MKKSCKRFALFCISFCLGLSSFSLGEAPVAQDGSYLLESAESVYIPLTATDDGLPDPPGTLTWIIASLPEHGRLFDPDVGDILEVPYVLQNPAHEVGYQPCSYIYSTTDGFQFYVDDGGDEPDGGQSDPATITLNIDRLVEKDVPEYGSTNSPVYPLTANYKAARQQVIYLAAEVGEAKVLTNLLFYVDIVPGQILKQFTIRIKYTDREIYTIANRDLEAEGWTVVYQADTLITAGWNNFQFQNSFSYNGSDNLLIDFSFYNSTTSMAGNVASVNIGNSRTLYQRSSTLEKSPLEWTGADFGYLFYVYTDVPKLVLWGYTPADHDPLEADFNLDCRVNMLDLYTLAGSWQTTWNARSDIVDDSVVNFEDLLILGERWMRTGCGICGGADLTGDGNVDLLDLASMADEWLLTESTNAQFTDIDGDGKTDLADLTILIAEWLDDGF